MEHIGNVWEKDETIQAKHSNIDSLTYVSFQVIRPRTLMALSSTFYWTNLFFYFSKHQSSGPMHSINRNVHLSVRVCVHF